MKNFIFGVLLYVSMIASVYAVDVEIGFGETHYIKQTDGVWYQNAYPYWMDAEDQNLSLGISWKPTNIRYRAEFLALGKHYVNAVAIADGKYNPYYVANCVSNCGEVVLQGRGSISGLLLSASRDVQPFGLPLYVEAGVYVNVKKWQVSVISADLDANLLAEVAREQQIDYGPVLGFGVRYSGVDIAFRYIYLDDSSEGDPITPMMAGSYTLMFKAYF